MLRRNVVSSAWCVVSSAQMELVIEREKGIGVSAFKSRSVDA